MLSESKVRQLVEEKIKDTSIFLVEVTIRQGNKINIYLDSNTGVSINDCAGISRHIEKHFDREQEDFSLEVSSAGLTSSFKVKEQYLKNIGQAVKVKTTDGMVIKGRLLSYSQEGVTLESVTKEKKKQIVKTHNINLDDISETKFDVSSL